MESVFITKTANEWIEDASLCPIPKMLFSEFWFEGELSVLFADTNLGKSILAVQIGDSISKGFPIENFKLEAHKQKVLYFDFELVSKQLENRYSNYYQNHFLFDENFIRAEINFENESVSSQVISNQIEDEILKQDVKVVIIDNLTYLSEDNEKGKQALNLMKQLKELKVKHQLSILVLSHTPKREFVKPISNNDLQGSKMLINFFDSAFAIGRSYTDASLRYIKQIKQRNCEQIYNEENVCVCTINKGADDNFLQFQFMNYDSEYNHLNYERQKSKADLYNEAKRLRSDGMTYEKIGEELGFGESTIRYWFKTKP